MSRAISLPSHTGSVQSLVIPHWICAISRHPTLDLCNLSSPHTGSVQSLVIPRWICAISLHPTLVLCNLSSSHTGSVQSLVIPHWICSQSKTRCFEEEEEEEVVVFLRHLKFPFGAFCKLTCTYLVMRCDALHCAAILPLSLSCYVMLFRHRSW